MNRVLVTLQNVHSIGILRNNPLNLENLDVMEYGFIERNKLQIMSILMYFNSQAILQDTALVSQGCGSCPDRCHSL